MPSKSSSKLQKAPSKPSKIHIPVELVDSASLNQSMSELAFQRRISDLEEQTKLIPLLQIQIQALQEERHHLQSLLESRAASTSSSSPHHQPVFQAHRVSPVSLSSYKIPAVAIAKRSVGTSTSLVLRRDVGCSPAEASSKTIQKGTSTDLVMKVEGMAADFTLKEILKRQSKWRMQKCEKLRRRLEHNSEELKNKSNLID